MYLIAWHVDQRTYDMKGMSSNVKGFIRIDKAIIQ